MRTCTICSHEKRTEIDKALVAGESYRGIARHFAVSEDAVERHGKAHLPGRLAKAHEAKEVARADDLLASIVALRERLQTALKDAQAAKDVAALGRELRETLRLMLELEGRLRQGAQVNVGVAIGFDPALQAKIVRALAPFPEARAAVVGVLEGPSVEKG